MSDGLIYPWEAGKKSLVRARLRNSMRAAAFFLLRVRVSYTPAKINRLARGKTITVANHASLLDGPIVALVSPVPMVFGVDTAYSRHSRVARFGMALVVKLGFAAGVVPLDAGSPFGLRELQRVLKQGGNVMIFPTGTIAGGDIRPGVSWLVGKSGAEVIEVTIQGAEDSRLFARSGTRLVPEIGVQF